MGLERSGISAGRAKRFGGHAVSPEVQAFLSEPHPLFIGGLWRPGQSGETLVSHDPATGLELGCAASGGAADIDAAVRAARKAFEGAWGRTTGAERGRLLRRLADLVSAHAETLSQLEILDNGMPRVLAQMITAGAADLLDYYAGWAVRIEGVTTAPPPQVTSVAEALTYTLREPVGVVGQIIPWNVPLSMACLKLGPALAAGCTVVLKPAEETPLTAVFLGRLIAEAGFPEGVVNIVNGPGETAGAALVAHPDVDKISFTGSTEVGRLIVREAAATMKKVSLELGGKSPVVVFPDADLDLAVPGVAMATFFLQGQNCMAGTRIFVHEKIHDALVERMAAHVAGFKVGHGLDPETMVGPLISETHKQRVLGFISEGLAEGGQLAAGGEAPAGVGHFVAPTIFTETTPSMRLVREEIFGPVMAVQRFGDEDLDALARRANDSKFGLSGSVWTRDLSTAHKMAARIRAGQVSINCHGAVASNIPFGGYKQSGWGREFGREGLDLYLETKAVTARL
jgi:phenylacetaldehyde dehydrogenase